MDNNAVSQAALITNTLLQLTNSIKKSSTESEAHNTTEIDQNQTSVTVKTESPDVQSLLGFTKSASPVTNKPLSIYDRVAYETSKSQQQQIAQFQMNGNWSKFIGENLNSIDSLPSMTQTQPSSTAAAAISQLLQPNVAPQINGPTASMFMKTIPSLGRVSDVNITLWQFLLELLQDPEKKDIISWTNDDGQFKLHQAEEVARLWGMRKNKTNMNYDKLSRALRYYYDKNIIQKVNGLKFVYRFTQFPPNEAEILERTRITNQIQRIGNGSNNFNNSFNLNVTPPVQLGSKRSRTPDGKSSPSPNSLPMNTHSIPSFQNLANFNSFNNLSQLNHFNSLDGLTNPVTEENGNESMATVLSNPINQTPKSLGLDMETVQTLLNPNVISTYANLLATLAPQLKNLASDNILKTVYDKLTQELVTKSTSVPITDALDSEPENKKQKLEIVEDEPVAQRNSSNENSTPNGAKCAENLTNEHLINLRKNLESSSRKRKIIPCLTLMYCDDSDEENSVSYENNSVNFDLNSLQWTVAGEEDEVTPLPTTPESKNSGDTSSSRDSSIGTKNMKPLAKIIGERLSSDQVERLMRFFK